jgi:hypothetical protein
VRSLPVRRKAAGDGQDGQEDDRDFTHDEIDDVVDSVDDEEFTTLRSILEDNVRAIGGKVARELGLTTSAFDHDAPEVVKHLETFSSTSITKIGETTKDAIRAKLAEVADEGGSIRDAGRAIREVFKGCSTGRAELIAQTENLRSSGFATQLAFKQSGLAQKKYWQHGGAEDDPRQGHVDLAAADPIDLDEPFVNPETGAAMQYPGDSGDPAEDCRCHCSHWVKIEDPKAAARLAPTGEQQRAWRAKGESALKTAAKAAFARQQKAVLAALRS